MNNQQNSDPRYPGQPMNPYVPGEYMQQPVQANYVNQPQYNPMGPVYSQYPPYLQPPQRHMSYQQPYVPTYQFPISRNTFLAHLQPVQGSFQCQPMAVGVQKCKKNKYFHVGPCVGTLRAQLGTDPRVDAEILNKAFRGLGCDENIIVNVLTHRTSGDRTQILRAYNENHSKDLRKRLISELYEPLESLMVSLVHIGPEQDAFFLRKATKGLGTNESALREILCTRSSQQIEQIKSSYQILYSRPLLGDVQLDTSGSFSKILETLINCPRSVDPTVDQQKAQLVAAQMYQRNRVISFAPDDLIPIFCLTSYPQLAATFQAFYYIYQTTVYSYLKGFTPSDYVKTLMAIYLYLTSPLHFFAKSLREAIINGNIKDVIRIISTRCEIDLASILQDYRFMYNSDPFQDLERYFPLYLRTEGLRAIFSLMGR